MNVVEVMALQYAILLTYFVAILFLSVPMVLEMDNVKGMSKFLKRLIKLTWLWLFLFLGSSILYIFQ